MEEVMDELLLEKLGYYAKDLAFGMLRRTRRLPDKADFVAGFKRVVEEHETGKKSDEPLLPDWKNMRRI
jgi:hypothetical protein